MRNISIVLFILFSLQGRLYAEKVPENEAKILAENFLNIISDQTFQVELIDFTPDYNYVHNYPHLYIFKIKDLGFIITSTDDRIFPILAYSFEGDFNSNNSAFLNCLQLYNHSIDIALKKSDFMHTKNQELWKNIEQAHSFLNLNKGTSPLLTTKWGQDGFFNDDCPEGTVVGSVASSMAQIMRYWNYPFSGSGMHSYIHKNFGLLSANFSSTNYQWSEMPNTLSNSNNHIARLLYQCGVAVNMQYGDNVSGAYLIESDITGFSNAETSLKNHFSYDPTLEGIERKNYSDSQWIQLLKEEIDNYRPFLYAGFGILGGSAFVCDGYQNDYFHINWGWSGQNNGYFVLDALNPSGEWNNNNNENVNNQQAIIGIKPETGVSTNFDLRLFDFLSISNPNINYGDDFTIYSDIANYSASIFSGEVAAGIFDENNNFIEIIQPISVNLNSYDHFNNGIEFLYNGQYSLLPGTYYVSLIYKANNLEWEIVSNGNYSNKISFTIHNNTDLELYSEMTVNSSNPIEVEQAFNVVVDVANIGTSDFLGYIDISLFNLKGEFIKTIQTLGNISINSGFYQNNLTFFSSGISIPPGNYLIALRHKTAANPWEITGSSTYSNPQMIVIKEKELQVDIYEPNNSIDLTTILPLNYTTNTATYSTQSANIHHGLDIDYYKVQLSNGYNYRLEVDIEDLNNPELIDFSSDVLYAYKIGTSDWEVNLNNSLMNDIVINGGNVVYFAVAPQFQGFTGSYQLNILVERESENYISDVNNNRNIKIFPNPVSDHLNINCSDKNIHSLTLLNSFGGKVSIQKGLTGKEHFTISMNGLQQGIYFLKIHTSDGVFMKEIMKLN